MKTTEIKINIEAREAGYKAAEAAAHAKFDAAQKAYDEACHRFATATAEERDEAEKAMNEAHDYCYGEAQAEFDAARKAAFEKFFSMNPTEEEIAAAEAENNTEETAEVSEETADVNTDIKEDTSMTITTKTAKNGSKIYYIDGKRTSREVAINTANNARADKPFTVEYTRKITTYFNGGGIETNYRLCRETTNNIKTQIEEFYGYNVCLNFKGFFTEIYSTHNKDAAKKLIADIENAYFAGEYGIKIHSDGAVEILADDAEELADDTGSDTDETADTDNKTEYLCVNDDEIQFKHGKFFSIWSYTYDAGFYADAANYAIEFHCIGGNETRLFDDEEAFFKVMEERGACTIDDVYKPTRPMVETLYFNGDHWYHVKLEQEIVNHETLLFDKDDLLIIVGHHGAKIMFLPNGEIAFFLQPFDPDTHRYIDDFDRVDEDEFWIEMTERGLCTLDPVNNELIAADYEFADNYNEFDKDCRRFLVNGEIITFSRDRWLEIDSPKLSAKIDRSMYLNTVRYHLEQWNGSDNCRVNFELPRYNVSVAEFWWSMYRRGFMQRAMPFRITIEHDDAPASVYDVADLEISYMRNGDNYDVIIDDDKRIVLATLAPNRMHDFIESIELAFVSDAGITIHTDGTVLFIADADVYNFDACTEINRHAPEGWTITFDTKGRFFPVKFKDKQVTKLDSLATQKFLSPEKFFEQFKPLVDKKFTPRDQFLADRYNELDMLEQMREEIADDDVAQLKTLEDMINQVKRDITAEEFAC